MNRDRLDSQQGFRHLHDEVIYQGHIWTVVSGRFESPAGEAFERDIVRSPGAVGVVPLLRSDAGDLEVLLLRQYRATFDEYVIEIPAGMRDVQDEPPEVTAQRELAEEAGYTAGRLDLLHEFLPSPGMTDAVLHVFLGSDLEHVGRHTHGPEEDDMEVLTMSLDDAVDMVIDGRIRDAKSVIGLLLAQRRLRGPDISSKFAGG